MTEPLPEPPTPDQNENSTSTSTDGFPSSGYEGTQTISMPGVESKSDQTLLEKELSVMLGPELPEDYTFPEGFEPDIPVFSDNLNSESHSCFGPTDDIYISDETLQLFQRMKQGKTYFHPGFRYLLRSRSNQPPPIEMFNLQQISQNVKRTWHKISTPSFDNPTPISTLTDKIYQEIFVEHPHLHSQFIKDSSFLLGIDKLLAALTLLVISMPDVWALRSRYISIGKMHAVLGIQTPHLDIGGTMILKALSHLSGDEWNEEIAISWVITYSLAVELMVSH